MKSELDGKQALLHKVFEQGLIYENRRFRTPYLHPAFAHSYMRFKEKGLLEIEQPLENLANLDACTVSDVINEHFWRFIKFVLTLEIKPQPDAGLATPK